MDILLRGGIWGRASVPAGASKGIHEAVELRDGGKRYSGLGVRKAISKLKTIEKSLKGMQVEHQAEIDGVMNILDGHNHKKKLGANTTLGVSLACARAAALANHKVLHEYLGKGNKLPVPCCNVINGGIHAGNNLQMQEFLLVPYKISSFKERMRAVAESYHALKKVIEKKHGKNAINVGDEGGFAPPISTAEEALDLMEKAVRQAGYSGKMRYAIDAAASEFYVKGRYKVTSYSPYTSDHMIDYYKDLVKNYKVVSVEDPFAQDDFESWKLFTKKMKIQIVGDDLLVTNPARIKMAVEEKLCNALLLKVNQIGTLTEAMDAANLAKKAGWNIMISHRSGETCDDFIADLAVAIEAGQIKAGAPCRGERLAKYNQLLRIEEQRNTYKRKRAR